MVRLAVPDPAMAPAMTATTTAGCGACGQSARRSMFIPLATSHRPWLAAWVAGSAIVSGWNWWKSWRKRKDRKRAASLVGAKSRALRDAIVKRARNASRGARPVLRPVPGGAR